MYASGRKADKINVMKIGIYDPYLDDLGGGEKYMLSVAAALSPENDVDIFWDNANDFQAAQMRFSLNLPTVHLVKNIFSSVISTNERLLGTRKYDVLIILSDGSIPFTQAKKLFLHLQQPIHLTKLQILKTTLKKRVVSGFFYNSAYTKVFNEKYFGKNKSYLIYPPVRLVTRSLPKEDIILHVGRFRVIQGKVSDYKKQSVMVDTFKRMVDNGFTGWKFVLAVSLRNVKEDAFEEMVGSAKGYPVRFLINKNNKELQEVYSRSKIYWHASGYGENLKQYPQYAEHFGISTVEAMGAGAVPVVINEGGQKEIITSGKNGFLWDTLDELEKLTIRLSKDRNELERVAHEAKARAQDFSEETFNKKIRELVIV